MKKMIMVVSLALIAMVLSGISTPLRVNLYADGKVFEFEKSTSDGFDAYVFVGNNYKDMILKLEVLFDAGGTPVVDEEIGNAIGGNAVKCIHNKTGSIIIFMAVAKNGKNNIIVMVPEGLKI